MREDRSVKPSKRYARDAALLVTFREVFVDLINHAHAVEDVFSYAFVSNTDNATWQRKRRAVAAAAGAAGRAYADHGGSFTIRNAAYVLNDVSPLVNWEMSLKDPEQLHPETVIASLDAAIASATQMAREAAERERGVTGLIAAFLRWPSNLRDAVGPESSRAQRTAAGAIGIFGQVVAGTLATALGGALIAGVVKLWGLLT